MSCRLKFDVVTIFPGIIQGFLSESMLKRAFKAQLVEVQLINLRDFTTDQHRTTDDRPYGGGPGMIMKPEPLFRAIESVKQEHSRVVFMTPQGSPFNQQKAQFLQQEAHIILVCGHYEGVDERVREQLVTDEISIGDYVLTNGVLAAAVLMDAVIRLIPGVLGNEEATQQESFSSSSLDHPHYTRPPVYRGFKVPDVLLSGDHKAIKQWRQEQAKQRTLQRRPDLLNGS